jgi:hypothetical protein
VAHNAARATRLKQELAEATLRASRAEAGWAEAIDATSKWRTEAEAWRERYQEAERVAATRHVGAHAIVQRARALLEGGAAALGTDHHHHDSGGGGGGGGNDRDGQHRSSSRRSVSKTSHSGKKSSKSKSSRSKHYRSVSSSSHGKRSTKRRAGDPHGSAMLHTHHNMGHESSRHQAAATSAAAAAAAAELAAIAAADARAKADLDIETRFGDDSDAGLDDAGRQDVHVVVEQEDLATPRAPEDSSTTASTTPSRSPPYAQGAAGSSPSARARSSTPPGSSAAAHHAKQQGMSGFPLSSSGRSSAPGLPSPGKSAFGLGPAFGHSEAVNTSSSSTSGSTGGRDSSGISRGTNGISLSGGGGGGGGGNVGLGGSALSRLPTIGGAPSRAGGSSLPPISGSFNSASGVQTRDDNEADGDEVYGDEADGDDADGDEADGDEVYGDEAFDAPISEDDEPQGNDDDDDNDDNDGSLIEEEMDVLDAVADMLGEDGLEDLDEDADTGSDIDDEIGDDIEVGDFSSDEDGF